MQAPFAICLLRLQVGVLTGGIEAGAVLGHVGKFAMPHDASLWVILSWRSIAFTLIAIIFEI